MTVNVDCGDMIVKVLVAKSPPKTLQNKSNGTKDSKSMSDLCPIVSLKRKAPQPAGPRFLQRLVDANKPKTDIEPRIYNKPHFSIFKASLVPYNLSKQYIAEKYLAQLLKDKTVWSVSQFFAKEKSANDYIIIGIVAAKSCIKECKGQKQKYSILTLTDFTMELPIFLFGKAFDKYYKIQFGQVIAVPNPEIIKPKNSQICIKLSLALDTIHEIGISQDIGHCLSLLKNGQQCTQWINTKKSDYCEYHIEAKINKIKSSRLELQSGGFSNKRQKQIDPEKLCQLYEQQDSRIFGMKGDNSIYDPSNTLTAEEKRAKFQRQLESAERERKWLDKLQCLRDAKVNYMETVQPCSDSTINKPFSSLALRRMGYDPTNSVKEKPKQSFVQSLQQIRSNIMSSQSDSDDLEIVH